MKQILFPAVLYSSIMFITACNNNSRIDSYTVGFATPSGNQIWVRRVIFDDKWTTPVGTMACCWEEARASSFIQRHKLPAKVEVEWIDESEMIVYNASVNLDKNLTEHALNLPKFTVPNTNREYKKIYLIVGMKEAGDVIVWLSNAPYSQYTNGRVLEVVGQAKAKGIPWIPPDENDLKNYKPDTST